MRFLAVYYISPLISQTVGTRQCPDVYSLSFDKFLVCAEPVT